MSAPKAEAAGLTVAPIIVCGEPGIVERGRYFIGYSDMVDGYRHAYWDDRPRRDGGQRVRHTRKANHPADARCPECHPLATSEGA
jgi:hypothetical protein